MQARIKKLQIEFNERNTCTRKYNLLMHQTIKLKLLVRINRKKATGNGIVSSKCPNTNSNYRYFNKTHETK